MDATVRTPDVSILIPTFSRPRYLREAILSVLSQTHPNLEVLVGDDGSQATAVASDIGDPRVRVLGHPQRLGMARNWNALLDASDTDAVALLMDDDRLVPTFVEQCLRVLEGDTEIGVVFSNHYWDRGGARSVRSSRVSGGAHHRFATTFLRETPVAVSAAMMRRNLWKVVRPLPDTAAADMVLFGRLAELGIGFHYIDEPLMISRVHGANLSSTSSFRSDVVDAWRALHFSDPEAEALRATKEAEALLSRAALRIRGGHLSGARADVGSAGALGMEFRGRARVVRWLSSAPRAARLAAMCYRLRAGPIGRE